MSDELKKVVDDLNGAFDEFKKAHQAELAEVKKGHEATAETKQLLDRVQDELDQLEARFNKLGMDTPKGNPEDPARKAFMEYARKGVIDPAAIEAKAIIMSDESSGGVLAPVEYVREIIKGAIEYDPVRDLARVRSTLAQSIKVPKRTGTSAAVWVSETGTRSETTGLGYGHVEIPTHEQYALVDLSNQLLEDAVFDLEAELRMEFSEQFGVAEGDAFVDGTGVGKPEGVLTASIDSTTSASNDALAANDFIDILYALKELYHANATYLMNRLTVRDARKLKDSNGQYIWQPALAADVPATINGRPYRMSPGMPVVANAAKAVVVGDFRKGYTVVDRVSIAVQRDPFTQATSGMTRFIARKRVGGQVVVPEAFKVLTIQ